MFLEVDAKFNAAARGFWLNPFGVAEIMVPQERLEQWGRIDTLLSLVLTGLILGWRACLTNGRFLASSVSADRLRL